MPEKLEAAIAQMRLETRIELAIDASTKDPWPTWTLSGTLSVGGEVSREDNWVVERVK